MAQAGDGGGSITDERQQEETVALRKDNGLSRQSLFPPAGGEIRPSNEYTVQLDNKVGPITHPKQDPRTACGIVPVQCNLFIHFMFWKLASPGWATGEAVQS